jgi:hypothetical protein
MQTTVVGLPDTQGAVMGAFLRDDLEQDWFPLERTCLYCFEPVEPPAVYWHAAIPVLLHGPCARSFGAHLIADSREAELASGIRPWPRRAARVLRDALMMQEARR